MTTIFTNNLISGFSIYASFISATGCLAGEGRRLTRALAPPHPSVVHISAVKDDYS
jgi:hypothetical protein